MTVASSAILTDVVHLEGPGKLRFRDGGFIYEPSRGDAIRIAAQHLCRIVCHGPVEATAPAMEECARRNIDLAWLTLSGHRFRMRLVPPESPSVLSRLKQLAACGNPLWCLEHAKKLVSLKLETIAAALRHGQRHGAALAGEIHSAIVPLMAKVTSAASIPALRGLEGAGSAMWFDYFRTRVPLPWTFTKRIRRPATDAVNSLLGLASTLLCQRTGAIVAAFGLEPAIGTLHAFRPGRPSLACDLMEPFRVSLVDRWVLRMLRGSKITPEDFVTHDDGSVTLTSQSFGPIVAQWETEAAEQDVVGHLNELIKQMVESLPEFPDLEAVDYPENGVGACVE